MTKYSWQQRDLRTTKYYNYEDFKKGFKYNVVDLETGREYEFPKFEKVDYKIVQVIPPILDNQEFFNWLCKTSPDGWRLVPAEYKNKELIDICIDSFNDKEFVFSYRQKLTKEQCQKIIYKMPSAIEYIPEEFIDSEMVRFVLGINPKNILKISSDKVPIYLRDECYKKVNGKERKELVRHGYMEDLMTTDRLKHLINSRLILNKKRVDYEFWKNIPKEIITEEIAKLMFDCNSEYVRYIPEKYLTNEMIKQALEEGKKIISVIPKTFMTKENVEMALKRDPNEIFKLPEDVMDQYLNFVVGLRGSLLECIPYEKKTKEMCEIAFKNDNTAFKYIPHKFITEAMCIMAVRENPRLVKNVPITILNEEFLNILNEFGIVISKKDAAYINEVIRVNAELNTAAEEETSEITLDTPREIANIYIQDLNEYFSKNAQILLESAGIYTLGELFESFNKKEFIKQISDKAIFSEIFGTKELLRCKYLNEDPLIDINSDELDRTELFEHLGLSRRTINSLMRSNFCRNSKEFIEKMSSPNVAEKLKGVRNLGKKGIIEIMAKIKIILDYYNRNEKQESPDNQGKINEANEEIERLLIKTNQYTALIKKLRKEVQELKEDQNSMGGNTR